MFDAVDSLHDSTRIATGVLSTLAIKPERMMQVGSLGKWPLLCCCLWRIMGGGGLLGMCRYYADPFVEKQPLVELEQGVIRCKPVGCKQITVLVSSPRVGEAEDAGGVLGMQLLGFAETAVSSTYKVPSIVD